MKNPFGNLLLKWYDPMDRPLPWKGEKDPYKIWLSEIILQQTRAAQGTPYYLKFTEKYPTILDLAKAPIDDILSDWQGLGYYSRARNLHFAANTVLTDFQGVFPKNYKDILSLKGIGQYTAAAISSFAYGLPYPVIDGNVKRVISRYFAMDKAIDSREGNQAIDALVNSVFVRSKPALFNQAIMDFGANVCSPKPKCADCILLDHCQGRSMDIQHQLPFKAKKIKRKKRFFHFFYLRNKNKILIQRREDKDIWQGLYQLPVYEADNTLTKKEVIKDCHEKFGLKKIFELYKHKQLLTHQEIHSVFWEVKEPSLDRISDYGIWIQMEDLKDYGFPRTISRFFEEREI